MTNQARGFSPGSMQISGDEIQETLANKRGALNAMQSDMAGMAPGHERENIRNLAGLEQRNLRDATAASATALSGGARGSINGDMNGVLAFDYARHNKAKGYAGGGIVDSIKGALGMRPKTPEELRAADAKSQARNQEAAAAVAERNRKAQPAPQQQNAVSGYAGMSAMQRREKEFGLKDGGRVEPRGFKAGGMIRGPGTGTSDSIPDEMQPGTFIMPADSTKEIGPDSLKNIAKVPVRVSNGEFEFTPEQVQSIGAAVLTALKDATHEPVQKHADGGIVGRKQMSGPGKKEYNEKFAFGPGTGRDMAPYDFTTGFANRGFRVGVNPQRLFGGGTVAFGGLDNNVQRAGYGDADEAERVRQRGMRFNATFARDQRRIDSWEDAQSPEGQLKAAQAMEELTRFTSPKSRQLRDWDTEQRYRGMQQRDFQQTGYMFADGGTVRGFSPRDAVQYFDDGGKVLRLDGQVYPPGSRGARMLEQELQKAQDREATGRAIVDAVKAPFGKGTAQPAQSMYAPDAVTAEPPNPTDQRLAQGKQQSPAMPPPAKTAAPQANAQAESANVGVGNMGREGMTNAQVGAANPQGRIKVERQANGTLSLSGADVRGDVSYTDASGSPLAGGGLRGKGFGRFAVAPAGAQVAAGPNGSYAFANDAPSKQAQQAAPSMSAEQMGQYAREVEAARVNMVGNQIVANMQGSKAMRDWNDLRSPVGIAKRNLEFDMKNAPPDRGVRGRSGAQAGGGATTLAQQAAAGVYRDLAGMQFKTAGNEGPEATEQQRWQQTSERQAQAESAVRADADRKYGLQADELGMRREAAGFQTRADKRRESVYDNYSKAKTDEDRQAIAKQFPDLFGQAKDAAHRMEVVRGKTDPMTGQSSGDYVVVQDPKTGEVRQIQMGAQQAMPKPASKAEFDALPKGTRFTDPNGQVRIK